MAQADVLALVQLLSNGQADSNLALGFYTDAMQDLGKNNWHTTATPITITAGNALLTLPNTLLNLLVLIYDNDVLSDLSLRELESIRVGWRIGFGRPIAYTREIETAKSLELFPVPDVTAQAIIPVHGLPVGQDYTPGNAIAIYAENRIDALPYLTLPIALQILYREYARTSDHTDHEFAKLCKELGDMLFLWLLSFQMGETGNFNRPPDENPQTTPVGHDRI